MTPDAAHARRIGWRWFWLSGAAAVLLFLPTAMMAAAHALSAVDASSAGAIRKAQRHHHWAGAWCIVSGVVALVVAIRIGRVL